MGIGKSHQNSAEQRVLTLECKFSLIVFPSIIKLFEMVAIVQKITNPQYDYWGFCFGRSPEKLY